MRGHRIEDFLFESPGTQKVDKGHSSPHCAKLEAKKPKRQRAGDDMMEKLWHLSKLSSSLQA